MELLSAAIVGVLSGIAASTVFLFSLSKFKPSIEISNHIARSSDDNGKFFAFKIINKGRRAVIDIRADAALARYAQAPGGPIFWTEKIPLVKDFMFEIGRFDKRDSNADYALRFVTNNDLDRLWTDGRDLIRLRIIATDSLTGFSQSFVKEYRVPRDCIKDGAHEWGPSLGIR